MKKYLIQKNKNKGFTMLFAVLVSSLVLSVGASIISITLKQISLSGSARDSQFAFYASNTGVECAVYWDLNGAPDGNGIVFATSSGSNIDYGSIMSTVHCGEGSSAAYNIIDESSPISGDCSLESHNFCVTNTTSNSATTKFRVEISPDVEYCADVFVTKTSSGGFSTTTIESRGYNTCVENHPRRIERGLRITY